MIYLNVLSVMGHVIFGLYLLRKFPRYTILWGLAFFLQTWSLISCCYNDFGIYNFELFRYTETTLATTRLALFFATFNLGFCLTAHFLRNRPLMRRDYSLSGQPLRLGYVKLSVWIATALVAGYVAYTFATGGIPILEGIHKALFFQEAGPVDRFILIYGSLIAFLLGYYRRKVGRISVSGVLLAGMIVYLLMTGNKFSALIRVLVGYYAAVFVEYWRSHPNFRLLSRRNLVYGLIGLTTSLCVAYVSYVYWGQGASGAGRLLVDRVMALQGHLWWATDYQIFLFDGYDSGHWLAELTGVLRLGEVADGTVGMKYVMLQAIGAERAFPIFETGYLYAMAYPAILVLTFPYPVALVVQFLAGAWFALLLYYLYHSLSYRHMVRSLIAMSVIMPYLSMLNSGTFYVFVTPGIAFKLLILLTLELGPMREALTSTPESVDSASTMPSTEHRSAEDSNG